MTQDGLAIPNGENQVFSIYVDPDTSEAVGEERTLCGAMANHQPLGLSEIAFRGVVYAKSIGEHNTDRTGRFSPGTVTYYWRLTEQGKIQLANEHERLLERWRK